MNKTVSKNKINFGYRAIIYNFNNKGLTQMDIPQGCHNTGETRHFPGF
jgi:hypothetical protein